MKIHTIHNKLEEKILRTPCAPFDFKKFSKEEIRELIKAMRLMMIEANGIGLAANQIGLNISVFVARNDDKFYAIFNPRLTDQGEEKFLLEEGCLSVPGTYGTVERFDKVVLEGQDKNGKKIKIKAWGLLAHIFQHEVGHLQGQLYIDIAKSVKHIPS